MSSKPPPGSVRASPGDAGARLRADESFRLLVESVVDYAIFMLDPDGCVQTWNPGAQRIKGYAAAEIIGRHFSCFYPPDALATGWPAYELQEARLHGRFEDEGWRVRKDGTRFWASIVITALYDEDRQLRGFAKVTRDLSERRRVEALEESRQRMTEFLAMLAHELRNPLAPLRNATQVLLARPDDAEAVRRSGEMLGRQVDQLTRLVDDLLDISRVSSGKIVLKKTAVDLNEIVARAVESIRPLTEEKHQRLNWSAAPQPLVVYADDVRLWQIAVNLLTNASKYTPERGSIDCLTLYEAGEAVLRVADTGIGISPQTLPHVFELFTQDKGSIDHAEGGLGIGLALVERLARVHGGRVAAHSAGRDRGSTFVVRLPLHAAAR